MSDDYTALVETIRSTPTFGEESRNELMMLAQTAADAVEALTAENKNLRGKYEALERFDDWADRLAERGAPVRQAEQKLIQDKAVAEHDRDVARHMWGEVIKEARALREQLAAMTVEDQWVPVTGHEQRLVGPWTVVEGKQA